MRFLIYSLCIVLALSACTQSSKNAEATYDTITTESGLKYFFIEKGEGRQIEPGSEVSVITELYIKDSLIWDTYESEDSMFTFIHQNTPLIEGFTELHDYLREGDVVGAVLPYQIAYGEAGRPGIPAKSSLIYNPLTVRYVSEPKIVISDTLEALIAAEDIDAALEFYQQLSDEDMEGYHADEQILYTVLQNLMVSQNLTGAEKASLAFEKEAIDNGWDPSPFQYIHIMSLEGQEKLEEALTYMDGIDSQNPQLTAFMQQKRAAYQQSQQ